MRRLHVVVKDQHALKLVLEGAADPIMISVSTSALTYQIIGQKNGPA
jgi:hypothetical protein